MRWVLRIKNLRGLVKKGVFEERGWGKGGGEGNMKLCGLWDYAHYEQKVTLSLPEHFGLRAFLCKILI